MELFGLIFSLPRSDKIAPNNVVPVSERRVMGRYGSLLCHPLRRLRPLRQRIVVAVPRPGPIPAFLCQPERVHVRLVDIDHNTCTRGLVCCELVRAAQSAPQSLGAIFITHFRDHANMGRQVAYFFTTLFFGLPGWSSLRKRIQQVRIDSVMKIE
jgi:hypothetical protein